MRQGYISRFGGPSEALAISLPKPIKSKLFQPGLPRATFPCLGAPSETLAISVSIASDFFQPGRLQGHILRFGDTSKTLSISVSKPFRSNVVFQLGRLQDQFDWGPPQKLRCHFLIRRTSYIIVNMMTRINPLVNVGYSLARLESEPLANLRCYRAKPQPVKLKHLLNLG